MARSLTVLGLAAKWVAVPAGLAALGFYFVGPRILPGAPEKVKQPLDALASVARAEGILRATAAARPNSPSPAVAPGATDGAGQASAAPDGAAAEPPAPSDRPADSGGPKTSSRRQRGPEVEVTVHRSYIRGEGRRAKSRKRAVARKPKAPAAKRPVDDGSYGGTDESGPATRQGGSSAGSSDGGALNSGPSAGPGNLRAASPDRLA